MLQTLWNRRPRLGAGRLRRFEDVSLAERVITIATAKATNGGVPIRRSWPAAPALHIGARRAGRRSPAGRGLWPDAACLTRQRVGQWSRPSRWGRISKRVYPHLLRHTVATRLLALGMDITHLQRFLGHETSATTRLYAETTAVTLRRKFDQVTAPGDRALVQAIAASQERRPPPSPPTC